MDTVSLRIEKRDESQPGSEGLDAVTFSGLASAFPKLCPYKTDVSFYGLADANSPVPVIIDRLVVQGIDVFDPLRGVLGYFTKRLRNYTPEELAEADYLYRPELSDKLGGVASPYATNEQGMPIFDRSMVPLTRLIGTARSPITHGCMMCRGDAVERIARLGLSGLSLIEASVSNRSKPEIDQTVRVIWSNRVLPSALNLMSLEEGMCEYAQLPPEERDAWLSEGFAYPPEIHYNRADLAAFGDFDLALMHEQTRMHGYKETQLVVSRRFCELLRSEFGLTVSGIPVRLRDDRQIPWAGPYPTGWEDRNVRPSWLADFEAKRLGFC